MVELRVILVDFRLLLKVEVPGWGEDRKLAGVHPGESTHCIISSTPKSFLHFSALISISLAFARSNFRARKNLFYDVVLGSRAI